VEEEREKMANTEIVYDLWESVEGKLGNGWGNEDARISEAGS
jgi:hypothetical protein